MSRLLASWLTAALLARYEYQPPAELSVMDPTRADMSAKTAAMGRLAEGVTELLRLGRRGEKCLSRRRGPSVLIWKVESASSYEIAAGDFSGCRMPGMQKASRKGVVGKRVLQCAAAAEIVDSSANDERRIGREGRGEGTEGKESVITGHVEFEHLKSAPIHIESVQKALFCILDVFACCCHDWELGRLEEAPREFKSDASGGWGCQDPRESHVGGDGLWRMIQMAHVKLKATVTAAKEKSKRHECHLSIESGLGE